MTFPAAHCVSLQANPLPQAVTDFDPTGVGQDFDLNGSSQHGEAIRVGAMLESEAVDKFVELIASDLEGT